MYDQEVSQESMKSSGEFSSPCETAFVENKSFVQTKIKDYFCVVPVQTPFRSIHWVTFHSVVPGICKILKKTPAPLRQTFIQDFFSVVQ